MAASDSDFCACCGEPMDKSGYCTKCFLQPEIASSLKEVGAEIILAKNENRYAINSRWVRLGRDPANQIVLENDRYSSRYHAWITYDSGVFWLEDLGSTNGTLLNGDMVDKRARLKSGDKIRIGETDMTFVWKSGN